MELKLVQPKKAYSPIRVTEDGMLTESKSLQLLNAKLPIDLTVDDIVTLSKTSLPLQLARFIKAYCGISLAG